MRAQLLDPEFANDTVQFMELQVNEWVGGTGVQLVVAGGAW